MIKGFSPTDPGDGPGGFVPPADEHAGAADTHSGSRRPWGTIMLAATALAVVGLEASAYHQRGLFEEVAAWLWALAGLGFVVLGSVAIARAGIDDLRRRNVVTLLLPLAIAAAIVPGIDGVEILPIYHEAAPEVLRGLESMERPGWWYTGFGHVGYPNRQYLIAAVPSAIFGRGLVPLRLGHGLPFAFGLLLFWAGLRHHFESTPGGIRVAPLAAVAVLAFPYALTHLHNYEQTIFPLSATLAAVGWLALTVARPSIPRLLALAWIGALLGCSYTPNLSSWLLLITALAWLAVIAWRQRHRQLAVKWLTVAVMIAGVGALSFQTRLDFFKPESGTVKPDIIPAVFNGLSIFFFGDPLVFIPAVLWLPVVFALFMGLAGRMEVPGVVLAWWIIGTVVAASTLHGYSLRPMAIEMFRVLGVIPPLLLLTAWVGTRLFTERRLGNIPRAVAVVFGGLLVAQVAWSLISTAQKHNPALRELVYADMLEQREALGISEQHPPTIVILSGQHAFANTDDFLPYFFPGHRLIRNASELESVDASTGPVLFYVDRELWRMGAFHGFESGDTRTITYEHPHHHHRMIGWGLLRGNPGDSAILDPL